MGFVTEFAFKFFPEEEFESVKGLPPDRRIAASVRNCLRLLMMGYTPKWRELITPEVFRAVFIERSPQFIKWMRQEFQYGFNFLLEQLQSLVFIEDHHFEQIHLYISNCLSYFPFADPNPYESITIPQRVGRLWQGIEYKIKPIELTSGIHHEADRVFAYGLEPLFVKEAESHLIFMGTTYPAGQGFLTQIRNNFKGFESVGKDLYRTGRNSIHAWLERQTGAVHVCGTSLGGALGLLLAIDEGNYRLSRVDVLNPPGLHDAKNKSQFDHWEILARKPQVVIQLQGDDPVSTFGVWKPDWKLLRIMPPHDKRGPNGFWDHALNYAGIKGTEVRELDPVVENGLRKRRNFWLFSLGRRVIYHLLQIYAFIVRPVQNFIMNYAQELMIFTLGASIFILTGFSVLVGMLTLLAIAGSLMEKSPTSSIKIGDPYLPRNESLDLYNPKNTQEFCFSYQEIHSYFLLMRCLLKNKELTPHRDGFLWQTQLSKKQLLEQSLIPENAERKVNIRLSKAKAFMIFKVLELPSKSKQNVLSTAIDEIYQEYKSGKIN